jgi:nitrous oxidase accessory protein
LILSLALTLALVASDRLPRVANAADVPFDLHAVLAGAQPGATIHVPAGVHLGPFQITQRVTLLGDEGAILDGGGQGDVVVITAPGVTLRNLTIRNSGISLDREDAGVVAEAAGVTLEGLRLENVLFGLYLKNAPNSVLRNNLVFSKDLAIARRGDGVKIWYSPGCLVEGNQIVDGRDVLIWYAPHCTLRHNLVERSRYGLHLMNSDDLHVAENVVRNNSVGIYLMFGHRAELRNNLLYNNRGPSGFGIGLKDSDDLYATGNRIVSNRIGLYVDNSPSGVNTTVRFTHNLFAYNEIGATLLPLVKRNVYVQNIFLENGEQVWIAGRGDATANAWAEAGRGNFWSDYAGFDADGDGVGDLPYRSESLFEDLLAQRPELRLFQRSPATAALDLAARAFPIFQPQPKLTDAHPLVVPPALPAAPGLPTAPLAGNLVAALGMLLLAAVILVGLQPLQALRRFVRIKQAMHPRMSEQ